LAVRKFLKGVFTFEDFILALIVLSLATALIVSNLFIYDHRTVEQMLSARNTWNADSTADMFVKKYVKGSGELDTSIERHWPDTVQIQVGHVMLGSEVPHAGNVYSAHRLVFVNGRGALLTVKTW